MLGCDAREFQTSALRYTSQYGLRVRTLDRSPRILTSSQMPADSNTVQASASSSFGTMFMD